MDLEGVRGGDILRATVAFRDQDGEKQRPVLVLENKGYALVVAYGSTKKVDLAAGGLAHELVLTREEAALAGLSGAGRFDLGRRETVIAADVVLRYGHIAACGPEVLRRMVKAAKAAGLI